MHLFQIFLVIGDNTLQARNKRCEDAVAHHSSKSIPLAGMEHKPQ